MFKSILLPTDGSELSEKAVHAGIELAKALNAKVTGVHVLQLAYIPPAGEFGAIDPNLILELQQAAREEAERLLARTEETAKAANVACELALIENQPVWKGILEAAQKHGCDLIVMASHGRRGLVALVLGSETYKVLTHTKIPVLVHR